MTDGMGLDWHHDAARTPAAAADAVRLGWAGLARLGGTDGRLPAHGLAWAGASRAPSVGARLEPVVSSAQRAPFWQRLPGPSGACPACPQLVRRLSGATLRLSPGRALSRPSCNLATGPGLPPAATVTRQRWKPGSLHPARTGI